MAEREEIICHVTKLLDSEQFSSSPSLAKLLAFCVNTTLAGEGQSLKETTIGVSVFGRPPGYDTKLDPIVRVNAMRLRQKLELFYQNGGESQEVQITIPKGTYIPRFERRAVEELLVVPTPASPDPTVEVVQPTIPWPPSQKPERTSRWIWALLALLLLVAIASATLFLWRRDPKKSPRQSTASLLHIVSSLPGAKADPTLSPDGKDIAFSWEGDESGIAHVYLQHRNSAAPTSLTNSPYPEVRPVWSGDGREIALLRQTKPALYQLVLVDVATRKERVLRSIEFAYRLEMPALDWSPDEKWLIVNEKQGDKPAHLILVSATDGASTQLTDPPDGSTGDLEARFSPDGKEIAFRRGQLGELYVASIQGTQEVKVSQLTFTNPGVRGVSWSPDGKSIFFGGMNGGSLPGIWRFHLTDSSLTLVTPAGLVAISPNVSRDGSEILFSAPLSELNLWQYHAAEDPAPRAFEPLTALQITPSVSPDGKMIVFASDMSGSMELWVSPIDRPAPRQITAFNGDGIPVFPSWSADGRKVVFFCRKKGLNYAFEASTEGGTPRMLRGGADYTLFPQYSPDNKWLYYVSNFGHRFRIWRVRLANLSSQPEEMTMQDVSYFRLTPDGRALYFSSRDGMTTVLNRKDIATGQIQTIWEWKDIPIGLCDWDVSGHRLYFVSPNPESLTSHLLTVDLDTHVERDLGKVRTTYWFGTTSIAATPDGNSVWVSKIDRGGNNIMSLRLQ